MESTEVHQTAFNERLSISHPGSFRERRSTLESLRECPEVDGMESQLRSPGFVKTLSRIEHAATLTALALVWSTFTSISVSSAKAFLNGQGDPLLLTLLTFGVGSLPWLWLGPSSASEVKLIGRDPLLLDGLLHFCNGMLTNIGLQGSSITTIYSIKVSSLPRLGIKALSSHLCMEPIVSACLVTALTGVLPTSADFAIVVGISLSMMIVFAGGFEPMSIMALIAGFASVVLVASRSIVFKNSLSRKLESQMHFFAAVNFRSLLWGLSFLRLHHVESFLEDWQHTRVRRHLYLAVSATLIYNYASLLFLRHVSPVTHSISNVLKRISTLAYDVLIHPSEYGAMRKIALMVVNCLALLWTWRTRSEPTSRLLTEGPKEQWPPAQRMLMAPSVKVAWGSIAYLLTAFIAWYPEMPGQFAAAQRGLSAAALAEPITAQIVKARSHLSQHLTSSPIALSGIHRTVYEDAGDLHSSPFQWLVQLNQTGATVPRILDIHNEELEYMSHKDVVIIGGGGLLGVVPEWDLNIEGLLQSAATGRGTLIGWGVGFDRPIAPGRRLGDFYPSLNGSEHFALLGIRDRIPGYRWVPCASVLAPGFDHSYSRKRQIGLYKAWNSDRPVPDLGIGPDDVRLNNGLDLGATIEFLGSSEILVTNSYYGLYWATLLGCKVILLEVNSRQFDYFPWPPIRYSGNLTDDVMNARTYPHALRQARTSTMAFWHDVKALLANKTDEIEQAEPSPLDI